MGERESTDSKIGRLSVVWKITPLFADWMASSENILSQSGMLRQNSTILELGCGIAGIVAMTMAPRVGRYIATDQEYVFKCLGQNIEQNTLAPKPAKGPKHRTFLDKHSTSTSSASSCKIQILALDWEKDQLAELPNLLLQLDEEEPGRVDAVVACDCIYNEALVEPFARTCAELCGQAAALQTPTVCVVAQQLRSHAVFEAWLGAFHKAFRVWRVPDHLLTNELKAGCGFAVHVGILRDTRENVFM